MKDITGLRSGKLVAVKEVVENGYVRWLCRCDCGGEVTLPYWRLNSNPQRSCGCNKAVGELDGKRFGMLVAVKRARDEQGRAGYLCRCDCGTEKVVITQRLNSGAARTCGCRSRGKGRAVPLEPGTRFGLLTVTHDNYTVGMAQSATVTCDCDCGTKGAKFRRRNIVYGITRHCGCKTRGAS